MKLIISFFVNAFAIWLSAWLIGGVNFDSWQALAWMTIALAIVNTIVRPLVRLISLPITIITLGIFNIVINAAMVSLAAAFVSGFTIDSFWYAIAFSIVVSIVSTMLGWFTKD